MAGFSSLFLENEKKTQNTHCGTSPKMLLLCQNPLIQAWQQMCSEGRHSVPEEYRPVFEAAYSRGGWQWTMPGNLLQPKASGVPTFSPSEFPSSVPGTVLEEHPLLVFPIPCILAFRAGCWSVPGPTGCVDNNLLRYALCDPVLQYFLGRAGDRPFGDLFEPNLNKGSAHRCHGFFDETFLCCQCDCCAASRAS